jgi:hypothetical protein
MVLSGWIRDILQEARHGKLPPSEVIVEKAFEDLGYVKSRIRPDAMRAHFNETLYEVFKHTLKVLESFEAPIYGKEVMSHFVKARAEDVRQAELELPKRGLSETISALLEKWYPHLREVYLSISQSRKTRGGKDFELQLARLFQLSEIPYEMQKSKERVDFFLPSYSMFQRDRNKTIVASAKRTLRERWKQVAEELYALRSPNVYLLTADDSISPDKISGLKENNLYLVVWDQLKSGRFLKEDRVVSFSVFINDILPHFEPGWH